MYTINDFNDAIIALIIPFIVLLGLVLFGGCSHMTSQETAALEASFRTIEAVANGVDKGIRRQINCNTYTSQYSGYSNTTCY